MEIPLTTQILDNPLLPPIFFSLTIKRVKKTGLVPRNWLLILLHLLDLILESEGKVEEDDVYSYDFTLKKSRAKAIPKLLRKHGFPTRLGMSHEGITVRGAPGLRIFRAWQGGAIILDRPKSDRDKLIQEAIELVRAEMMRVVGQRPVKLHSHLFDQTGTFVTTLLEAVENRSFGRVEQALVAAKLQLRFPDDFIPIEAAFAGDQQTQREADVEVRNIRVIVSAAPKDHHFQSAISLSDRGREVYLIVTDDSFDRAKRKVKSSGYAGRISVATVDDYVTNNMKEIAQDLKIGARDMCIKLAQVYNKRISRDNDRSLRVILPK